VDHIGQQSDAATGRKHSRLSDRGCAQNAKRPSDGAKAGTRPLDARIHETMAMTRTPGMVLAAVVLVSMILILLAPTVVVVARMRERDGSSE
jgi:hypothetical protein